MCIFDSIQVQSRLLLVSSPFSFYPIPSSLNKLPDESSNSSKRGKKNYRARKIPVAYQNRGQRGIENPHQEKANHRLSRLLYSRFKTSRHLVSTSNPISPSLNLEPKLIHPPVNQFLLQSSIYNPSIFTLVYTVDDRGFVGDSNRFQSGWKSGS